MFAYFPEFVTEELEPEPPRSVCWSRCTVSVLRGGGKGQAPPGHQLGQVTPGYAWVGKAKASVLLRLTWLNSIRLNLLC